MQFKPVRFVITALFDVDFVQTVGSIPHISGQQEGLLEHCPIGADPFGNCLFGGIGRQLEVDVADLLQTGIR